MMRIESEQKISRPDRNLKRKNSFELDRVRLNWRTNFPFEESTTFFADSIQYRTGLSPLLFLKLFVSRL